MNKNLFIGAIAVILLIAGGAFVVKNSQTKKSATVMEEKSADTVMEAEESSEDEFNEKTEEEEIMKKTEEEEKTAVNQKGVKTFEIDAENFKFSETEIRVKQGDKVKIVLEVDQGMHDWVVDEFTAKTKQIKEGETDTIEFVADKKGTFEYYCSVGEHRKNGMVGKLIVE